MRARAKDSRSPPKVFICTGIEFTHPTGRLGLFYTTQSRYRESHGVRVGMTTADAERLLGRRLRAGCETNIHLYGSRAALTIVFDGRRMRIHRDGTVTGGHVYALVLHGLHHDPGVFECT